MAEFDWDKANLRHIALHSVSPEEAEQALQGFTYAIDAYEIHGEERVEEVGQTKAGRILKVVTTVRSNRIRVVTAFDAVKVEKIQYLEHQIRHDE